MRERISDTNSRLEKEAALLCVGVIKGGSPKLILRLKERNNKTSVKEELKKKKLSRNNPLTLMLL